MVKRLATLVAVTATLLAPATPALGQTALLFSGGLNRASIAVIVPEGGDDFSEYLEPVTRMSAGLAVGIPLSEGWNIELGGSYSQKGSMPSTMFPSTMFPGLAETSLAPLQSTILRSPPLPASHSPWVIAPR